MRRDPQYPYTDPNRPSLEPKKITRVDVIENPGGLLVRKYVEGWQASTPALSVSTNAEWTLDQAVEWLKEHDYTVRTGPGGARAWLGNPLPVRSRGQILRLRDELLKFKPREDLQVCALDLAYDY